MESILNKQGRIGLSAKTKGTTVDIIVYLFILLFVYTAAGKFLTIETFEMVLVRYPIIGGYSGLFAYAIPSLEIVISFILIYPPSRRLGLLLSLILMFAFLTYIIYMFASGSDLPCSCGGIISKLSWGNHIWFNSIFIILAILGIKLGKP